MIRDSSHVSVRLGPLLQRHWVPGIRSLAAHQLVERLGSAREGAGRCLRWEGNLRGGGDGVVEVDDGRPGAQRVLARAGLGELEARDGDEDRVGWREAARSVGSGDARGLCLDGRRSACCWLVHGCYWRVRGEAGAVWRQRERD
jgi:hypothetical protein